MSLEKLRDEMDSINHKILDDIKRRQEIGLFIALNKKKKSIPIKDKKREEEMFSDIQDYSKKIGLDPDFCKRLFRDIVDETIRVMEDDNSPKE